MYHLSDIVLNSYGITIILTALMVLYLAADLIWGTRVRSVGDEIGVPMRPVRSLEMLEARLADSPVRGVVLDLEAPDAALTMIQRLRGPSATPAERAIRIVAWGPHVAVDLLTAAKQAGADAVMARGAFSARLPEILVALETVQPKDTLAAESQAPSDASE